MPKYTKEVIDSALDGDAMNEGPIWTIENCSTHVENEWPEHGQITVYQYLDGGENITLDVGECSKKKGG